MPKTINFQKIPFAISLEKENSFEESPELQQKVEERRSREIDSENLKKKKKKSRGEKD